MKKTGPVPPVILPIPEVLGPGVEPERAPERSVSRYDEQLQVGLAAKAFFLVQRRNRSPAEGQDSPAGQRFQATRDTAIAAQIQPATEVPLGVPDRYELLGARYGYPVTHRQRITRPAFHPEEVGRPQSVGSPRTAEVSRALAAPSPRREVAPGLVKDQQLIRTAVGDHDPPIPQLERIVDLVKLEVPFALDGPDRDEGLGADLPAEARTVRWPGILDEEDAGAVLELGPGVFGVRRNVAARSRFAARGRQSQSERKYRETDQFPGPREILGSSRWMYGTPASVSW